MKKALVIGASSGIGKALAQTLANNGYEVGLLARRTDLLEALANEIPTKTHIEYLDVTQIEEAFKTIQKMFHKMGKIDLIILNSGIGFLNSELDWAKEKQILDVNVYGFCSLAGVAFKYFLEQEEGHLVGISSIGALRGNPNAPAYNASKAFISNYLSALQGLAFKNKKSLVITDIKPGFVDTEMAKGANKFWVSTPAQAAEQIYEAIKRKKTHAYITKRWRIIGWLLKLMPEWVYLRLVK